MTWHVILNDLLAGYVNQQSFEDAAKHMVFVTEDNLEYHQQYLNAIDNGIAAAHSGDSAVITLINQSGGYRVATTEAAASLLEEFRQIYLDAYNSAVTENAPGSGDAR